MKLTIFYLEQPFLKYDAINESLERLKNNGKKIIEVQTCADEEGIYVTIIYE